jgi:intein/homing endonuclease
MIDIRSLPKKIRDIIEMREATDATFARFVEEDYTEIFFNELAERADPNVEHSMIISCVGEQGCFLKGTLIQTKCGLKKIEDVVLGDLVWAGNAWRFCIPIVKGRQQTLKVALRNGVILRMTPDHKMKTENGWIRADCLKIRDKLVVGNVVWKACWSDLSIDAALVGMILADGHLAAGRYGKKNQLVWQIRICKDDLKLLNWFRIVIKKRFGINVKINRDGRGHYFWNTSNRKLFDWFVGKGVPVGNKSGLIDVPDWIICSDDAMNGFLSSYFACDGHFGSKTSGNFVNISSMSEKFIDKLMAFFLSRGLSCRKWVISNGCFYCGLVGGRSINILKKHIRRLSKKWFRKVSNYHLEKQMRLELKRLEIISVEEGIIGEVYDLNVEDVHEYLANGLISHNSGKSLSSISICSFLDPLFSANKIFFGYNELVYNRHLLKPNTAVLVDEQSQAFGLDAHRVNIILSSLKEQLRKKSIHFIFCSPVLYPEAASSMYILETIFVDFETREVYAALKTRDGLTLGHVRIPHPLKELEDGTSLASQELIDAYQDKKDAALEKLLGNRNVDIYDERAKAVMKMPLFRKAEKVYIEKMGYIPNNTLIQLINKIFPEYQAGVVPVEIAGRIKLEKELAGVWEVAGKITRKDRSDSKMPKMR